MRKIKIFSSSDRTKLQGEVNKWLRERPTIIIFNVLQTETLFTDTTLRPLTITIFYYEGNDNAVSNN